MELTHAKAQDKSPTTAAQDGDDWRAALSREVQLVAAAPGNMVPAISERVKQLYEHPLDAAQLVASGVAAGLAIGVLQRNPTALFGLGKTLAERGSFYGSAALAGAVGNKMAPEVWDTWKSPANLEENKILLGKKLGNAAVDYGLIGFGAAGAINMIKPVAVEGVGAAMFAPSIAGPVWHRDVTTKAEQQRGPKTAPLQFDTGFLTDKSAHR